MVAALCRRPPRREDDAWDGNAPRRTVRCDAPCKKETFP
jgi:hypothetical protein